MVRRSNRYFLFLAAFVASFLFGFSQDEMRYSDKDYQNKEQFEKFRKKRIAVGAWQINQLKKGALVVRLKTNQLVINALLKNGDTTLAQEKKLEAEAINLNTIRAYINNYDFSKLYFIYTNSSDSLLNGKRENIFVDTSLLVNPSIVMRESFYLLADRDKSYTSSIGFIKEDTARFVKETGNGVKEMAIVIKNKYGHQLKAPFPYASSNRFDKQSSSTVFVRVNGIALPFNISQGRHLLFRKSERKYKGMTLTIPKYALYSRISLAVGNLNEALKIYYLKNSLVDIEKTNPEVKPFLY